MPGSEPSSFIRYLAAKRSVDDRALNGYVWQQFGAEVQAVKAANVAPVRFLELGAGIGTMVERLLEWGLLEGADYTAVDASVENIEMAASRLQAWSTARSRGFTQSTLPNGPLPAHSLQLGEANPDGIGEPGPAVHLITEDVFAHLARTSRDRADVLIAHAFLDLVPLPRILSSIKPALRPGALLYLTINFDGATILEPTIDPELDTLIERRYHDTMDRRIVDGQLSGDSHTGRHLYHSLLENGYQVLAAGASDWVVGPTTDGYPGDEGYFLHFIVDTMADALKDDPALDSDSFSRWVTERRRQIDNHQMVFIAHQLDYLARMANAT